MMNIGIDRNNHAVYEGESFYGRALWPAPSLTPAKILFPSEGPIEAPAKNEPDFGEFMFREDSFDPVSGIRRGRFYECSGSQPHEWFLPIHPASNQAAEMNRSSGGTIKEYLNTYYGNPIYHRFFHEKDEQPIACLGFGDRYTIWSIINVEAISTGEDLVTLKARRGLGILPELDVDKIPDAHRNVLLESLQGFTDEVHRAAPLSVIDRARDAATRTLLAYFNTPPQKAKDLGKLIDDLRNEDTKKKVIAINAASIIARLHARGKPSMQDKLGLKPIREQDAELATQCVGTILCELGWAEWM